MLDVRGDCRMPARIEIFGVGYLSRVGVVGMLAGIAACSRDICFGFLSYLLFLERLGSLFFNETGMNEILG